MGTPGLKFYSRWVLRGRHNDDLVSGEELVCLSSCALCLLEVFAVQHEILLSLLQD